ncbi:MAG TPA: glycosyltransferase [Thermoleophilaceae bacterium]|nr:glycosyltransferase [Thermoleophilaceae bacterium]
MRVAVDARALREGSPQRGVARYLRTLLAELERRFPRDEFVPVATGRLANATASALGRPRLDRLAGGCDVVWCPAPAPVAMPADAPLVLTVHDLSFEHRPGDFTAYERLWHRIARPRRIARRAAEVITVSRTVAGQVAGEWGVDPARVTAVLSGPGRPPGPAEPAAAGVPAPYVLAVGALEPRKQPELLARAHAMARRDGLAAGLVFAGEGALAGRLDGAATAVLGRVSDGRLESLYEGALALVCCSAEEGFGFTPLEALARGCPAVVADLPVLEEVLGEGALRFPGGNARALADALLALEREPGLRERTVRAGAEAVAALSWERAARETHAVLSRAAAP